MAFYEGHAGAIKAYFDGVKDSGLEGEDRKELLGEGDA